MLITPSILNSDFANIKGEIDRVETVADWLHLDVMDGHFVPNLSFGPAMVAAVKRNTQLPVDVHLMITHPEKWIEDYVKAGATNISFHVEATENPVQIASELKQKGISVGLAIKPGTPFESIAGILHHFDLLLIMTVEPGFGGQKFMAEILPKVRMAKEFIIHNKLKTKIQVDGGVNFSTIKDAAAAGADIFVAGSVVYGSDNPAEVIVQLKQSISG